MFGLVFATALLAGGVGGMTVTQFVYADDGPFNDNRIINDVTIPTNLGDVVVFSGGVGEIGTDVQVAVPDKTGYTKDKKTVTAHVNSDGTITTSEKVTYTKAKVGDVVTGEVTVQSNLFPLILPVTGDVGSSVKVDVPSMKGYRADKSFVTVSISNTVNSQLRIQLYTLRLVVIPVVLDQVILVLIAQGQQLVQAILARTVQVLEQVQRPLVRLSLLATRVL